MPEQFSTAIQSNVSDYSNVYETIAAEFSDYLKANGYRDGTQHAYHSALMHFLCWLQQKSPQEKMINSSTVCIFLQHHLPLCNCPLPVYKELKTVRAALNQLLSMLGQERLPIRGSKGSSAVELALRQFDDFQRDVCGFTKSTRENRQRFVRSFLVELFGTGKINVSNITSEVLIKYVIEKATCLKPSSVGVLLSALRSYLRFLQFKGESTPALIASVPRPPNWSLTSLPPSLSDTEMTKFLTAFDISTTIGKRDYAMARCLVDIGLRCHEVALLTIDDIDWHSGVVVLQHNKSRREKQLPLPQITGHAIVDYLCNGRPTTTSRSLFVFHRAPFGCGVANTTVRGAIRRAFSRAGLFWTGSHILRHTIARRMVQSGITLKEVADVLRHQDIDTTQIYTKVNLPELKKVAMPWPGR
ncbi:MAG: site-specific recombinase XerD [Desulforhopalus sp.]|jgi:site-specific recombinase XerD